jgi:hypothetical protein
VSMMLNYDSWEVVRIDEHTATVEVDPGVHVILPRSALPRATQPGDLLLIFHSRPADLPQYRRND